MKPTHVKFWAVLMPLALVGCQTSVAGSPGDLLARLSGIAGLKASQFQVMEARYAETECVEFKRGDLNVGFVCRSRNKEFIAEMGVVPAEALPPRLRQSASGGGSLYAVTPMSQYKMDELPNTQRGAVAAVVDCDSQNSEVYRATASCHVAVRAVGDSDAFFSSFLLEDHVTKRKGLTVTEIADLWKRLK